MKNGFLRTLLTCIVPMFLWTACVREIDLDKLPAGTTVGSVTDIDGNTYKTLRFGNLEWMIENLRTTHYSDGTSIPELKSDNQWESTVQGACCTYGNQDAESAYYGRLYNWYAVNDSRKLAPTGWHVATNLEWDNLRNYLISNGYAVGGVTNSGDIAKAMANTGSWVENAGTHSIGNLPDENNASGFSAVPAGVRYPEGDFLHQGLVTNWWCTDYSTDNKAVTWGLNVLSPTMLLVTRDRRSGFSVRCIKDDDIQVETAEVTEITQHTAVSGGAIAAGADVTITERGICWNTLPNPTIDDHYTYTYESALSYNCTMWSLTLNTTYYLRAYVKTSFGITYGNEVSFTTAAAQALPTVTTTSVTNVTDISATSGGNVTFEGGLTVTSRGVCWSTSSTPTIADSKTTNGSGTGSFTSNLTGLSANTTYYVRAYATNSLGTSYGTAVTLTTGTPTLHFGTMYDYESNAYKTITIGTQTWMAENLRATRYGDNTLIPVVTDKDTWNNLTMGACCSYNNDDAMVAKYGRLYNGYAVTSERRLIPSGWHVATDADWNTLVTYLGSTAGIQLKQSGTETWHTGNNGTNSTGFGATGGGIRQVSGSPDISGNFTDLNVVGYWRTSTNSYWYIYYGGVTVEHAQTTDQKSGMSVRCVKD
jgi:uncharacterized protein (TIGR02145 family)